MNVCVLACRACELQPDNADAHVSRGRALEVLEDYVTAEAAFYAALSRRPDHARALVRCTLLMSPLSLPSHSPKSLP